MKVLLRELWSKSTCSLSLRFISSHLRSRTYRNHYIPKNKSNLSEGNGTGSLVILPQIRKRSSSSFHITENVYSSGSPKGMGIGAGFLLLIPLTTFGLGVWQVYRWKWKLGLIKEMEMKINAEPVEFPINKLETLMDLEYSKVKLCGKFDYSQEALIGPRSLISPKGESSRGLISHGTGSSNGYHVITPFVIAGENLRILVNRGWIPSRNLEKYHDTKDTNKEIEIVGVVRKHEPRAPFMQKNTSTQNNLWLTRDLLTLSKKLGTAEIFLDLAKVNEEGTQSPLPIPGQTRVTLRNEHVSYFLTWFSLSGITTYMWHRLYILKRPLR